jgi:hypothetical protein
MRGVRGSRPAVFVASRLPFFCLTSLLDRRGRADSRWVEVFLDFAIGEE